MNILKVFFQKLNKNYKPIVVFGEGRSGTTWLAQIVAASGYELNFEGIGSMNFAKDYNPPFKPIPSHYYVRKGKTNPYKEYMDLLMDCKIEDRFVHRGNINIGSPKKLIKLIRASLMVDWMQENYDFYGIFLIRNPLATINSQIKKSFFSNLQKKGVTIKYSDNVINYFNKAQQELIRNANTPKDRLAVHWCINNRIPLDVADRKTLRFIKYEDLIENPQEVVKTLSKFAHFPYNNKVKKAIKKDSFTTRKDTKKIKNYNPRIAWKKNFTQEEIDSVIEIVKAFNLEEYLDI